MKLELEKVKDWHLQFDEIVRDGSFDKTKLLSATLDKRLSFIAEESNETLEAFALGDYIEVLDGVADVGFVCAGFILECGLNAPTEERYVKAARTSFQNAVERLHNACLLENWEDAEVALAQLELAYRGLAAVLGLPYQEAFLEVYKSNMSKKNPDGSVIRNEIGKIQKPATFQPPDMLTVLALAHWTEEKKNI